MRRPELWANVKNVFCFLNYETKERKEVSKVLPPLRKTPERGAVRKNDGINWNWNGKLHY